MKYYVETENPVSPNPSLSSLLEAVGRGGKPDLQDKSISKHYLKYINRLTFEGESYTVVDGKVNAVGSVTKPDHLTAREFEDRISALRSTLDQFGVMWWRVSRLTTKEVRK